MCISLYNILKIATNIESFWYEDDNLDVEISEDDILIQELCPEVSNTDSLPVYIPKIKEEEWPSVELKKLEPKKQSTESKYIIHEDIEERLNEDENREEEEKVEILEKVIDKIVNDDVDDKKVDDFIPDPNKHTVKTYNPNKPLPFSNEMNDMFKNALNEIIDQYK